MIDGNVVIAGIQERNLVVAILIGKGTGGDVGFGVRHPYSGSHDHCAGGIGDTAEYSSPKLLSGSPATQEEQANAQPSFHGLTSVSVVYQTLWRVTPPV